MPSSPDTAEQDKATEPSMTSGKAAEIVSGGATAALDRSKEGMAKKEEEETKKKKTTTGASNISFGLSAKRAKRAAAAFDEVWARGLEVV
jgi:cobalamin-dependent methionine synthase I